VTPLLAARLLVWALAGPGTTANLGGPPTARVPVGCGQRVRPDALSAELAQPVLGIVALVAPVVGCRAIIPPPAHHYLHDAQPCEAERTAARP